MANPADDQAMITKINTVFVGLGIVALHYRPSTLYQIR
jgi:hypothetical protein